MTPGNQRCADCPAKRPLWVSFLTSPVEHDKQVGVFCCQDCILHHHSVLGEKRTLIKYLKMAHECKFLSPVIVMAAKCGGSYRRGARGVC
jgi:hypothetical protein